MKKSISFSLFCLFFISAPVCGSFSASMKERLPEIIAAKDEGKVGEGTDGYLHIRLKVDDSLAELVAIENLDRRKLFKALSQKTGGSEEEVAKNFSKALVKRGKKNHWYKSSTGSWVQK